MHDNARRRYALASHTVEYRVGKGWFYAEAFAKPADFKGPYSSIASVTLMIARQLRREVQRRDSAYTLPGQ